MPVYKFTAPSGKTVRVTGDTPPSESELNDIFQAAGVSTDVGSSTTVPEAPSVAKLAAAKTPAERIAALKDTPVGGDMQKVLGLARLWAEKGPHAVAQGINDFIGGDYAKGAHEAISGAGITAAPMVAPAAVAGAIAAPVTAGLTLAGGLAGGKLASMAADAAGATPDQSALAGDVGMVAGGAGGSKLPALASRGVAKGALNATAAALDNPVAGAISPRARNLGELAGKLADAIKAKEPASSSPDAAHLDLSQRVPAGSLTQQQIGERLAAARAQGMTAPRPEPQMAPRPSPSSVPVPPGPPDPSMPTEPVAVKPEPFNAPRVVEKPPTPKQINEAAIAVHRSITTAAREANIELKPGDLDALKTVVRSGVPAKDAVEALKASRDPAAELAKRLGTPSDAEMTFPPNKSGLPSKPPTARKARGKLSDLADMP